jgi:hypothetical protein
MLVSIMSLGETPVTLSLGVHMENTERLMSASAITEST